MDYQIPDFMDMAALMRDYHPDTIRAAMQNVKANLESITRIMDDTLDGLQEHVCNICEDFGYGYKDIPNDWAYFVEIINDKPVLLCNNCLGDWHLRYGLPEITREIEI